MAINKLFIRYKFSDTKLNVVLQDYKRKTNEIIDQFLGKDYGTLSLYDTDESDLLTLKWNEDDSNPRDLNFKVNKGNRTIDLSDNLTVESASILNQDYTTDASPTFAGLTLSGMTSGSVIFAGTSGLLSQDNSKFFFDDTRDNICLGSASVATAMHGGFCIKKGTAPSAGVTDTIQFYAADIGTTEKLTDGGLETWASATDLTNWTEFKAGGSVDRETSEKHGGTYSAKLTTSAQGEYVGFYQDITLTPGNNHMLTVWYKRPIAAGSVFRFYVSDSGGNTYLQSDGTWGGAAHFTLGTTEAWTKFEIAFIAHANYSNYRFRPYKSHSSGGESSFYIDDISVSEENNVSPYFMNSSGLAMGFNQSLLLSDDVRFATVTLNNIGLHLLDTDASHDLIIKPGSDLSADRILTLTTGDAARTITLTGNPTLADWFDQAVKAASNVSFGTIGCNEITIADGHGLNLQEDITFLGATTENLIVFPDNLANALSFMEGANPYMTLVSTNGSEAVVFGKVFAGITGSTIGNLTFADGSITDSGGVISFGNENLSTTGTIAASTAKLSGLTNGYIPYHVSDATGLANSPIFTDGTLIGIGTVTPGSYHHTANSLVIYEAGSSAGITIVTDTNLAGSIYFADGAAGDARYRGQISYDHATDSFTFYSNATYGLTLDSSQNLGLGHNVFGTNATRTLALFNGTAPTTSPANEFQMYSADIGGVAGKTGAHFRDEEGNVISLGSGGVLMSGTARVIKKIYLNNAAFTKGTTAPTQGILGNLNDWKFDIGDDTVMTHMLPADWAVGTDLTIKVCWYIDEAYAADKEVQWRVDWSALPHDFSEAVDAPTHSGQIDSGDIDIHATAKRMGTSTVGTISGASLSADDMLGFTLSRIAVTHDNPTADPGVHHLVIEYIADKLGKAIS